MVVHLLPRKSGNIVVAGKTLGPAEYSLIAPYLGLSASQRARAATNMPNIKRYGERLLQRPVKPMADLLLNTPCNRRCEFCFWTPEGPESPVIDEDLISARIRAAQAEGFLTTAYPKELNVNDRLLEQVLRLKTLAGDPYAITNGERRLTQQNLQALAQSSVRHLRISHLPAALHQIAYGRNSHAAVSSNIGEMVEFSRSHNPRPFSVGIFSQVYLDYLEGIQEVAREAVELGVETVVLRLTRPLGNAKGGVSPLTEDAMDRFLLSVIEARKNWPKEKLQILLSMGTIGPNYYSKGIWRYQLGLEDNAYLTSRRPCPMLDSPQSYTLLLPEEKFVFCLALVGEKTDGLILGDPKTGQIFKNRVIEDHLQYPSSICQPCDVIEICQGGCVANRLQGRGLGEIRNTNLDVCLTATLARWGAGIRQT
ncbi:MAG: hypothetical protein WC890_03265 [Candidatus Margulisiibacteriota bacterium]